jgi:hypothetical protein
MMIFHGNIGSRNCGNTPVWRLITFRRVVRWLSRTTTQMTEKPLTAEHGVPVAWLHHSTRIGNADNPDQVRKSRIGPYGIESRIYLEIDQLIRMLAKSPVERLERLVFPAETNID